MINKLPVAEERTTQQLNENTKSNGIVSKNGTHPANGSVPHFSTTKVDAEKAARPSYAIENEERPDLNNEELHPKADLSTKIVMLNAVIWPLVGCIIAAVMLTRYGWMGGGGWSYVSMVVFGWIITSLGITVGFHRLMSHKSFETYRWVRAFWMIVGSLSVEGSPLVWCAVHRRHHGHSDQEGDPHSPHLHGTSVWGMIKGFCHAQIGWLFTGHWSKPNLEKYVPDLLKDKFLVTVDKFYYLFVVASLLAPAALGYGIEYFAGGNPWFGAWLGFVWGGLVRIFVSHHITWSINSVCHVFGKRHFHSNDHSTNNVICGVLAMGEGWHNNHHAFPSSAKHGLLWYQFDMSWMVIRSMKALGLAWNIRLPSERALESKRINKKSNDG